MDKYSRERKYSKSKRPNRHCGQQIGGTQRHNGLNHYRKMGTILHKQKSQRRRAHFKNIIYDTMNQEDLYKGATYEEAADYDWCDEHGEPTCNGSVVIGLVSPPPVQIQYQHPFNSFNNSKGCSSGMGRSHGAPRIWHSNRTGQKYNSKRERWEAEGDEHRVQEPNNGNNYWYNRDTGKYQTFPNNKMKRLKSKGIIV